MIRLKNKIRSMAFKTQHLIYMIMELTAPVLEMVAKLWIK
jgi:hypothetical protein